MTSKRASAAKASNKSAKKAAAGKAATKGAKAAKRARPAGAMAPGAADRILQIKVTLADSRPAIWRRLEVGGATTLGDLHDILQIVMGWTNSHLHQFIADDGTYYSDPRFQLDDADFGHRVLDEHRVRLDRVASAPKGRLSYEYDFGDSWEHLIVVEKVLAPEPGVRYPRCVGGERAGPPDDCGGVWGYEELLEALRDETHPEHEDFLEWVPEGFDPAAFDPGATNRELDRLS